MTLKIIFIGLGALLAVAVVYWGARTVYLLSVSRKLVEKTVPYENLSADTSVSMLVIGDSTAVGVGASAPEDSTAGRIAGYVNATYVENYAVSGALVGEIPQQIAQAKLPSYDLVLVQVGANDIVRLHDAERTAQRLKAILATLPPSDRLVLVTAGDVGAAPFIPPPLRHMFTRRTFGFHEVFGRTFPGIYVNLGTAPGGHLFTERPDIYLAPDGFHPSSEGYGLWFNAIRKKLDE